MKSGKGLHRAIKLYASLSAHLDVIFFDFPGPVVLKYLSTAATKGVVAQFDLLYPNDCITRSHGEAMSTLVCGDGR